MKMYLLMMLCLLLTGCGGVPVEEAAPTPTPAPTPMVLEVAAGTEGSTIDPAYLAEPNPADVVSHLYEGLVKYAPSDGDETMEDSRLCLGLAEAMEVSQDGLQVRFTLRPDACWSDGVPVEAKDFVYAWRRLFSSVGDEEMAKAVGAVQLYGILRNARQVAEGSLPAESLGVAAEGERVLVVTLEQACPWFWKLCAMPCMVPVRQDIVEAYGGDWTNEQNIVVSGAYTIAQWVHDDYMQLVQNPYYYDREKLGPQEIYWYFGGNARERDFAAGAADSDATGSVFVAGTYYLYLNANAIRDWRVRAAMVLSVDRETLAAELGGGTTPAEGLVPRGISNTDGSPWGSDRVLMYSWLQTMYPAYDLTDYTQRCALAASLMDSARAAGTWYGSYKLYYRFNESVVNRMVAQRCQEDWRRVLGITVEFVTMEVEAYSARLRTNTFDVAYLQWLPDYDDPLCFLQIMRRGGAYNHSGWGDVRYNEQLDLAAKAWDPASRDAMLRKGEEMLYEKERFAVCPLFQFGECYYMADGVRGVAHSPVSGYWFGYATK